MSITSILVVYACMWFLMLLILVPIGLRTQEEEGEVVPGTHGSSPANIRMGRKMLQATIWAFILTAIIAGVVISGLLTVENLDFWGRMD
ncbi:DUF1467 family protein [Paracoccaceae bacterium GXU_MW_L88]